MKTAPLALCLVWAAPAFADVSVPAASATATWEQRCAARIDMAAVAARLQPHARAEAMPLLHENGEPNPVRVVEYVEMVGPSSMTVRVGEDAEPRPDKRWTLSRDTRSPFFGWFRRLHGRYARLDTDRTVWVSPFKAALDECLNMGDSK